MLFRPMVVLNELGHILRANALMDNIIHHNNRGQATGPKAAPGLKGEDFIGSRFSHFDTQLLAKGIKHRLRAKHTRTMYLPRGCKEKKW